MPHAPRKRVLTASLGHDVSLHCYGPTTVTLLEGKASVFGCPMRQYTAYTFQRTGVSVAALSAQVRVEVNGDFQAAVVPSDTAAAAIHASLDASRVAAASAGSSGPVVLVTGAVDTGKSTLCSYLVNRAVAQETPAADRPPMAVSLVDVDVGQSGITCPGTIATTFVRECPEPDEDLVAAVPLTFFFGDKTVTPATQERYLDMCSDVKRCLDLVGEQHTEFATGGTIINTMGWIEGLGLQLVTQLVDVMRVTDVVVTGSNPELAAKLRQVTQLSARRVALHEYPANTNIFARKSAVRSAARSARIHRYFCGTEQWPLSPVRLVVQVADVQLVDAVSCKPVQPSDIAPLTLCAVSHAASADASAKANVAGFVVVLDVAPTCIVVLAPAPGPLPSNVLLVSPGITLHAQDVPPL